jgi:hypothetical protein
MTNPGRLPICLPIGHAPQSAGNLAGALTTGGVPVFLRMPTVPHRVLVREFDAGRPVGTLNHVTGRALRVSLIALEPDDGVLADAGALGGVLNGPLQERAGGTALRWRNHSNFLPTPFFMTAIAKVMVPFSGKNGDIIFIDRDKRTNQVLTDTSMVLKSPLKQSFSGLTVMEKTNRISNHSATSFVRQLEEMRATADTIDGILSGVYAALSARNDIADEILQLLAIGAAKSQLLTEDFVSLRKPTLVKAN